MKQGLAYVQADLVRSRKQSIFFYAVLGLFVILSSFFYGLVHGLGKNATRAEAALSPDAADESLGNAYAAALDSDLADGLLVMPIGKDVAINGRKAEVLSFITNRSVKEILAEQVKKWEDEGLIAFGTGTPQRGVAMAADRAAKERYVINAWEVAPELRGAAAHGYAVQGIIARATGGRQVDGETEETRGLVPGIPLYPGGKSGAVFKSREGSIPSFSSLYRSPANLEDTLDFYRDELGNAGWVMRDAALIQRAAAPVGHLIMERGDEELTLLFSAAPAASSTSNRALPTLISVNLGPLRKDLRM